MTKKKKKKGKNKNQEVILRNIDVTCEWNYYGNKHTVWNEVKEGEKPKENKKYDDS